MCENLPENELGQHIIQMVKEQKPENVNQLIKRARALTKATGKPIIIENQRTSEDGKTIGVEYRIIEEEQKEPLH